ncbi:MAG TPA: DUF2269 family protein [Jatrophihabitans sp.]|nr:DUF2269 family protein [Jatrophihabitans sp.]
MKDLLLSLHVLFAIFAVGPLVGTATTAARGVRAGDAAAVAGAARTVRIYGYASLLVALLGMGLVQPKWDNKFGYPWVWLSIVLYMVALAVTLAVLVPGLTAAARQLESGGSAASSAGRLAAAGGIVALLFAVIVFLMVYQPH